MIATYHKKSVKKMASMGHTGRASYKPERLHSSSSSGLLNTSGNGDVILRNNGGGIQGQPHSGRSKAPVGSTRRSVTPTRRTLTSSLDNDTERVRVAVRLRPRNVEDLSDSDYAECVELQPELKRLKLRKNNWSSESYRFDELFTESASQKRVYEAVAKPVVEGVLDGYNGTVMAYGQTGTGKTYTVGRLGKEDAAERGIMVRALEDILAGTSAADSIEISYLQLYMESIQDLLAPEKLNIPIVEDAKTGEVSVPGTEIIKIRNLDHFLQLLQLGEFNRHAANTKMNMESSRSHAILMVYIRRSPHDREETDIGAKREMSFDRSGHGVPIIRKSKLLIVDLAGSERLDKSGSKGHLLEEAKFINLSLTSLGKCINALAENFPHIPTRDSKLTRLLRDSFGGSARTSLIVTIGPSSRHYAETASAIMFGQRAMKVVNTVKVKEELDYENLCRKLQIQVDHLSAEIDRQQKSRDNENNKMQKLVEDIQNSFSEADKSFVSRSELLQKENAQLASDLKQLRGELDNQKAQNKTLLDEIAHLAMTAKNTKVLEEEIYHLELELKDMVRDLEWRKDENVILHDEVARLEMNCKLAKQHQVGNSNHRILAETPQIYENKITDLTKHREVEWRTSTAEEEMENMKQQITEFEELLKQNEMEISGYRKELVDTTKMYEGKIEALNQLLEDARAHAQRMDEEFSYEKKLLIEHRSALQISAEKEIDELENRLQEMDQVQERTASELRLLSLEYKNSETEKTYLVTHQKMAALTNELHAVKQKLVVEVTRRKEAENELLRIMKVAPETEEAIEEKRLYAHGSIDKGDLDLRNSKISHRSSLSRDPILSQRSTMTKICEEVGLQKIFSLLESGDSDVQIQAAKAIANLASEDVNQQRIVQKGGLDALLMLLETSLDATMLRVASGAIANLAMNEVNQVLITNKGGAKLLADAASKTGDPQALRMVAGAIANLCGNEKLHAVLKEDGAIRALLGTTTSRNADVVAQVARGLANFAKCESRRIMQGNWKGPSLLLEDGALSWLVSNLSTPSPSTRRHTELAICHLAQNESNGKDFMTGGGLKEVIKISNESSREDIRNLANKALRSSTLFLEEMHKILPH